MGLKSILSVTVNGARRRKAENPAAPLTPKDVAAAAIECARAGAAIVHVHARTADGGATQDPAVYAEMMSRIDIDDALVIAEQVDV